MRNFVRDLLHGEKPNGRRVRLGGPTSKAPWMQIVGVVPDTYSGGTGDPSRIIQPMLYALVDQQPSSFMSIAVRTSGAPMALTAQVRDAVASLNPDIPLDWVYSMQEALQRPTWFYRLFGTLFMIFGVVALFLASVGLYAVMAFSVSRRGRELGIRIALGAQRGDVLGMIVRQGVVQLAIGMTAGLALAAAIAQVLTVILFDVHPRDPAIFRAPGRRPPPAARRAPSRGVARH
ncbi:MAG: FtsX-like permease family protein [Gemmatimonadaceae bacterium]|nr:FtsX-like permease family protein [Gemmatimonadaceae bacterium]